MKTDDLVALLATAVEPVDPKRTERRFLFALIAGTLAALLLTAGALGFDRPLLFGWPSAPMFWVREAFCSALALVGFIAVTRLARPGARLGLVPVGLAMPVLALWTVAAVALVSAPHQDRASLILGNMALECSLLIPCASIPLFIGFFWALRGLAPTRLRLAGAAAGLAAAAAGALAYSVYCPEFEAPFVGVWYLLGILIPTGLGAFLGPRLLRW